MQGVWGAAPPSRWQFIVKEHVYIYGNSTYNIIIQPLLPLNQLATASVCGVQVNLKMHETLSDFLY